MNVSAQNDKDLNTAVNPTSNTAITTLILLANAGYEKASEILERMGVKKETVFHEIDPNDVIITNFANSDMVGHTGVEKAAIEAVACIDECIGRVVEAIEEVGGQLFICADHGNSEMMADYETGEPWTAHTTNPVPFILVNYDPAYTLREGGCLADVVPTLIEMMGMEKPAEMTGESLLIKK